MLRKGLISLAALVVVVFGVTTIVNAQTTNTKNLRLLPSKISPVATPKPVDTQAELLQKLNLEEKKLQYDNLREYANKQNAEVQALLKTKKEELERKRKAVTELRKQCELKLKELNTQRRTQRQELTASCKPPTFTTSAATREEGLERSKQVRETLEACRKQIKEFDTQTKQAQVDIRKECFQKERQDVLGLSTEIPYNQQ